MSAFWTNNAGTWIKANQVWFNNAGTWVKAKKVYWNNAGTWQQVFSSGPGTPVLSDHTWIGFFTSTITFNNNGTLTLNDDDLGLRTITGEWLASSPTAVTPSDCAAFDVLFTWVSGPHDVYGGTNTGRLTKSGAAWDTWFNLATSESINLSGTTGSVSGTVPSNRLVFTAAIRPAGGGATIATATITMSLSG